MNKRKKALDKILRLHISTYDDLEPEPKMRDQKELDQKAAWYWYPKMPSLKSRFELWYEINNKGNWRN